MTRPADSTEQARCKCGHQRYAHVVDDPIPLAHGCLFPGCGCGSWRPAETAR